MYWGRYEPFSRMGTCPTCGAFCQLDSYSTRDYLSMFGIPLVPLGRQRVLDQCSICRGHKSHPLAVWQKGKRELTLESIRQHHQPQLLAQGTFDVAELGWAYAYFGQDEQAESYLRKAGDDPEVRARLGFV